MPHRFNTSKLHFRISSRLCGFFERDSNRWRQFLNEVLRPATVNLDMERRRTSLLLRMVETVWITKGLPRFTARRSPRYQNGGAFASAAGDLDGKSFGPELADGREKGCIVTVATIGRGIEAPSGAFPSRSPGQACQTKLGRRATEYGLFCVTWR
jgi:hypothetical protein